MTITARVGLILLCFSVYDVAAQSPLRQGGWELKTSVKKSDAQGAPEVAASVKTEQRCMTAEFLATNPYLNPYKQLPSACTISDHVSDTTSGTWTMICTAPTGRTSRTRIKVAAVSASFQTEGLIEVAEENRIIGTVQFMTVGRYLGACTPQMRPLVP